LLEYIYIGPTFPLTDSPSYTHHRYYLRRALNDARLTLHTQSNELNLQGSSIQARMQQIQMKLKVNQTIQVAIITIMTVNLVLVQVVERMPARKRREVSKALDRVPD
jgi:hypothetical protein